MKKYTRRFTTISFILMIMFVLSGIIAHADDPRTHLRFVHAAPWLQNVDVYMRDTLFFDNIFYRYISDYVPVSVNDNPDPEVINIKVRPADSSPGFPALIDFAPTLDKNSHYSFIVAGTLESKDTWWTLKDRTDLPGTGTSLLRIVHAALGTPATEFCVGDVCRTLAFKENTDYFLMDPGIYTPVVRPNGTKTTYIKIPPLKLLDNSIHTIFLTGMRQGEPALQLLYTFDAGEPNLNPHPELPLPPGDSPKGYPPPPVYPPVSGAFLSPRAIGVVAGIALIIAGSIGFWLSTRKAKYS